MSDSPGEMCPPAVSCSVALAELYAEDFHEHAEVPPMGSQEYRPSLRTAIERWVTEGSEEP